VQAYQRNISSHDDGNGFGSVIFFQLVFAFPLLNVIEPQGCAPRLNGLNTGFFFKPSILQLGAVNGIEKRFVLRILLRNMA
jgi:hypothetical protein